jgi:hypothetical protein
MSPKSLWGKKQGGGRGVGKHACLFQLNGPDFKKIGILFPPSFLLCHVNWKMQEKISLGTVWEFAKVGLKPQRQGSNGHGSGISHVSVPELPLTK